jgi:hypothetical protein
MPAGPPRRALASAARIPPRSAAALTVRHYNLEIVNGNIVSATETAPGARLSFCPVEPPRWSTPVRPERPQAVIVEGGEDKLGLGPLGPVLDLIDHDPTHRALRIVARDIKALRAELEALRNPPPPFRAATVSSTRSWAARRAKSSSGNPENALNVIDSDCVHLGHLPRCHAVPDQGAARI